MSFKVNHPMENKIALIKWAAGATGEIYLVSPFITENAVKVLATFLNSSKVSLLFRGRDEDFRFGACEKNALFFALEKGWEIRRSINLHAKVFVDETGAMIGGSANLTASGFSLHGEGNFEVTFSGTDISKTYLTPLILNFSKAEKIDKAWIERAPDREANTKFTFIDSILPLENAGSKFSLLDIPQSASLSELLPLFKLDIKKICKNDIALHDWILLGLTSPPKDTKVIFNAFLELPLVAALLEVVGDGAYFGTLRRWLEETVEDVPTPSRADFNTQLNRLYEMIVEASEGRYERVVPGGHSEMLRRR
jgi:hypothetical protein